MNARPVRVLVVDDVDSVRDSLREVLEDADGFQWAGEAASGELALEILPFVGPDVVLMDVKMPGMSGIDATRVIRRGSPAVAVVMHSAYDESEYERAALAAGASGYVLKGSGIALLLDALSTATEEMRAHGHRSA